MKTIIGTEFLGGYDSRVTENVIYHRELVALAESLELKTATTKTIVTALNVPDDVDVLFLLSVSSTLKDMLLNSARLLIYTPSNEHFGIVPLEAMLAGVPVLAANTGGPLETVEDGKTGWLRSPDDVQQWTEVMNNVLHKMPRAELAKMGKAGVEIVKAKFSDVKMAETFDNVIDGMAGKSRKSCFELLSFILTIAASGFDAVYFAALQNETLREKLSGLQLPPFVITGLCIVSWVAYFTLGTSTKTVSAKKQ
jgi:alpha-1,3/alpha-1,6-mannosyltransferase